MKTKWIKYEKKRQRLLLKGSRIQSLNRREMEAIRENRLPGVLCLSADRETPPISLYADLSEFTSLADYLKSVTVTRKLFAHLIGQIVQTVSRAEALKFSRRLFLFATEYVFLEKRTLAVFMLYVPLQPFEAVGSLPELLREILREAVFDESEPAEYRNIFREIIGQDAPSEYVLGEYLRYLQQDSGAAPAKPDGAKAPAAGQAALRERQTGRQVPIRKLPFRIGKQADLSDLRIESHTVSRTHAEITFAQGCYYLTDLASKNGTYLNGKQIRPYEKERLRGNDLIRFAESEYQFIIVEE